ncbi:hypothetical protein J6590_042633 [Homalodisca vitripennis]|nr:hypothetical protein J6590_042633 [Homalodisca vitripennis]
MLVGESTSFGERPLGFWGRPKIAWRGEKGGEEKSISGVMITSSQQREKVGDEPFRVMKTKRYKKWTWSVQKKRKEGRERGKGPTEEEEDALSIGRTSAELELRDIDEKQDRTALSPTTRTAAVRKIWSNSFWDLQSRLLKRDTGSQEKRGKRTFRESDEDSSIGYDLTKLINLIGSEVKKLHDILLENESAVRADEKRAKITAGVSVGTQTEDDDKGTPDRSTRKNKAKTLQEELSKKLDDDQISNLLTENLPGEVYTNTLVQRGNVMEDDSGKNAIITIQPTLEEEGSNLVRRIRKGLRSATNNYENAEGAVYVTVIPQMEQTLSTILEHEGKVQSIALTAYLSQKEQKRRKREGMQRWKKKGRN